MHANLGGMHANLGAINDPIVKPSACAAEFEVEPSLPTLLTVANALLLVRTLGRRQRGRTWSIAMTHHAAALHLLPQDKRATALAMPK